MTKEKKRANIVRTTLHSVVKQYIDMIEAAFCKSGYAVCNTSDAKSLSKKDVTVTDSPLVAIRYICKGYRNNSVWFQGISAEESYMRNQSKIRYYALSWIEKIVLKRAQLVFFVSHEMKRFYEKKYRLDLTQKSVIMPCFNETGLQETAFAVPNKYMENSFVYVGSLQVWQCFEETVQVYAEIEKRFSGKTKFYVFTGEKEEATQIIQKHGVQNYAVDCVPPEELSEHIKSMKYGFVLRKDNAVNNVATPTKFSNYLSNGIIPIYSSTVRSFAEYDRELSLGIICDLNDIERGIEAILAHMQQNLSVADIKNKCTKAFLDYYNQEKYIQKIAEKVKTIPFK